MTDGAYVFTFDCVDETGSPITGTYHGYDPYAGGEEAKVKPQLSTLKNIKQKKADSKIAPMMQFKQVEKIQQTKELMPLNIQKGKQKALFVK